MTTEIKLTLYVLFLHWLADFVFQSNWMAQNKSKANFPLWCHVGAYSLTMFLGLSLVPVVINGFPFGTGMLWIAVFSLLNGLAHFGVDFITSRINSKLWQAGKVHYFFVSVGFDQLIHYVILLSTIGLIL